MPGIRLTDVSKLAIGVNLSVNGYLSLCIREGDVTQYETFPVFVLVAAEVNQSLEKVLHCLSSEMCRGWLGLSMMGNGLFSDFLFNAASVASSLLELSS